MIVRRMWLQVTVSREWQREGFYLFGFIPLDARDCQPRERRQQ